MQLEFVKFKVKIKVLQIQTYLKYSKLKKQSFFYIYSFSNSLFYQVVLTKTGWRHFITFLSRTRGSSWLLALLV